MQQDSTYGNRPYLPFAVSALVMWLVLYLIYPYYQYYIDPDGTSYLTISQRYADGDFHTAVNGLWSPWACWLTALLIKAGIQAIPASVIVNAAGATGFLYISCSFFAKFRLSVAVRWVYSLTLVVFLCFAVFWQSFDDLWGCFFMLCVLRLMLSLRFTERPMLWCITGVFGALAYFAKAYSLPYFLLAVTSGTYVLAAKDRMRWFRVMFVSVLVMLLCAFPWLNALHSKYGIWTMSTAGPLNMSWFLVGYPTWKDGIDILLPPIYPDSVYYWDDPWFVNGPLSHYWDSWYFIGLQILRLGYNFFILLVCMLQLSVFVPVVGVYMLWQLFRKFRTLSAATITLYLFFIILPAGYVMVHIESRYLWIMLPITMVVVARDVSVFSLSPVVRRYIMPAFVCSLLLFPLWQLRALFNEGKEEYQFAQMMNAAGIKGADIVSNMHTRQLSKIMYFSGNRLFAIGKQKPDGHEDKAANTALLLQDIKRYHVAYYLYSPAANGKPHIAGFDDIFYSNLTDSSAAMPFTPVMNDPVSGVTLYRLPQ